MKITTPNDKLTDSKVLLEEAVEKFENEFKMYDDNGDYYHIIIYGSYPRSICNKIERLYTEAGWHDVVCKTSEENGERGGLTGLKLHREPQEIM